MNTIYYRTIKEPRLKTLDSFRPGAWIYVEKPDEKELEYLAKTYSLEAGHLRDALDQHEVPRLEIEGEVVYIFTRVPAYHKSDHAVTVPVLVVLAKDFLMTVSAERLPLLERFMQDGVDFFTSQKTKFLTQIFAEINSAYSSALTRISRRVRSASVKLERIENRDILQFLSFENSINDFLAALVPTHAILNNLLSGRSLQLFEEDQDLVEDLSLSNGQLIELCKSTLKTIVNIRQAYSTIITSNLNRVIKLLTALTIILTVPTIIASFYGMNVTLPYASSPNAFWAVAGVTAGVVALLVLVFSKNRWL